MLVTCVFSAISPCYFRMEARWRVEFTGVKLAAAVDKVAVDPVEKAALGERRGGEGGRQVAALWRRGDAS
jgi:hypothetical protein